jgi:hypothetical protein
MRNIFSKIRFTEAVVLTIAVTAVLLFIVWQLASTKVVPESEDLQNEVRFLSGELASIKDRLKRIQARQVVVEREADILRRANHLLREHESERQAELGQLQSELDFYSRLAGTGGTQSGLDIYRAEVIPTDSTRVFQFILTLTQNIRRAAIISGRARVDIEGTMDDRPVTLYWSQVSDGETPEPSFRFKYFQQVEGYLTLPEGFSPTRLLVTLEAKGQRKPIIRNYNWNELKGD